MLYAPVFQGDELRAIISATLARAGWPKSILDDRFPEHYIEIVQNGRAVRTVAPDGPRAADKWSQELPLVVQNARWTLRATPTQNLVASGASPLPIAALALGTILATLLALSTYLFQTARANAKDLKRTNERLVSDIARRYHVEQELRESESRTSLIINAVKDCAIYMLDTEGRVASWNPGAQALNGYTATEIIGKHFSVLYPSDRKSPPEKELVDRGPSRLVRGGMLAPAQGRQPVLRRRHNFGDSRRARQSSRLFRRHPRRDDAPRAARADRTRARLLFFAVLGIPEPGLALRHDRRLRLPEPGMARIHRAETGGGVRLGLAGRRAPGRSRALAGNHRRNLSRAEDFRIRVQAAARRRQLRLDHLQRPSVLRHAGPLCRLPERLLRQHGAARDGKCAQGKRGALSGHDGQRAGHGVRAAARSRRQAVVFVRQRGCRRADRRYRGGADRGQRGVLRPRRARRAAASGGNARSVRRATVELELERPHPAAPRIDRKMDQYSGPPQAGGKRGRALGRRRVRRHAEPSVAGGARALTRGAARAVAAPADGARGREAAHRARSARRARRDAERAENGPGVTRRAAAGRPRRKRGPSAAR